LSTLVRLPRQRVVVLLSLACGVLLVALPLLVAWSVLRGWPAGLLKLAHGAGLAPGAMPATFNLAIAACLAILPVACLARALWSARACLESFRRGQLLTRKVVAHLRGFAAWGLASGLLGAVVPTLAGLLLAGDGARQVALRVDSHQVLFVLFCGLTWQISAVLEQAVAIAEDHAQIV
jgi:hypothetical protein